MKCNPVIKQGQIIGIGKTHVELLVHVTRLSKFVVYGHVINGDWDFQYDMQTDILTAYTPVGNHDVGQVKVLFADPFPMAANYQTYNEVISYMNAHLNRWAIVSWGMRMKSNVFRYLTRFYKRLKTSTQMFIRTWKQGSTDIKYAKRDDIPF